MQGFASSAMLDCGTAHQLPMSSASMHEEDSMNFAQEQQMHQHAQLSSKQDHQHAADAAHASSGDSSSDDAHHHGATKCSACASCCLSSAISAPATLDPIAPLPTGLETSFQPDQQFTAHFPEGLERPPHSLAN
ncbi:hypothetical protein [Collimonas silvisoli]|uniref:hypothetical protein n=1 Tax=Collimonas silvisoli TaxID=2825884 RepID=UPI001B8B368D|nr:hypothetical protein [Collimonas silvisoli]